MSVLVQSTPDAYAARSVTGLGSNRVCIFTTDLGHVAARREGVLRQIAAASGTETRLSDTRFVGLRQTGPLADDACAFQPFVGPEGSTRVRMANALIRLVDARMAPLPVASVALSRYGDAIVEVILACDPDVVFLDVRWARYLKARLSRDFSGLILTVDDVERSVSSSALRARTPASKVSIVLPTYNGSRYLTQSIESCLDQSYRDLELIVVDDGSREDIRGVVGKFNDERLRYIRHERNQGLPAALNTGFRAASGAYLTWTSDDNYYAAHAIERLTRFLDRHPAIGFAYSSMYILDESSSGPPRVRRALPPSDLNRQNNVGACFLYRRKVYEDIGEYNRTATLVEDYDYWIRVSKRHRMQRILDPLYYYRYHDQSLTAKHTADEVARRFEVVREQNGLPSRA
jgi:hypothetical protein